MPKKDIEELKNQVSLLTKKIEEMESKENEKSEDNPKDEPKDNPKDEPKDNPKDEPKDNPKDEPKDNPKDFTSELEALRKKISDMEKTITGYKETNTKLKKIVKGEIKPAKKIDLKKSLIKR